MTSLYDRFAAGDTYGDYRNRIMANGGIMREMLEASERGLAKESLDLGAFARLAAPLRVLVLSEDWCGDCTDNLPILNRIAAESGKLEVRIVSRDDNPDLMDSHLNRGEFRSIPVMIFLDAEMNEIGHFIERPESVTELRGRKRQELYAEHPEFGTPATLSELSAESRAALQAALLAMRDETRPFAIREVVRELSEIVGRAG
jgi:hypothetical protein